jgi:hypothetical protein
MDIKDESQSDVKEKKKTEKDERWEKDGERLAKKERRI